MKSPALTCQFVSTVAFAESPSGKNRPSLTRLDPSATVLTNWHVSAGDFIAHFEVQYEGGDLTKRGSGLFLGAVDPGGARQDILILLRNTNPVAYRIVRRSGRTESDIVRSTPTSLLTSANNRIDVLSLGGTTSVYINETLVTSTRLAPYALDGRYGVFVSPGERYSFDNIVVSPLIRK